MFNFKENLYYVAAINYFLKGQNVIECENYNIVVSDPKDDTYSGIVKDDNRKFISFNVGIVNKKECDKNLIEADYCTKFYKRSRIHIQNLHSLSKEELIRFIFKPETITSKPYLNIHYGVANLEKINSKPFDKFSKSNPPLRVQIEMAKYAKELFNDIPSILEENKANKKNLHL